MRVRIILMVRWIKMRLGLRLCKLGVGLIHFLKLGATLSTYCRKDEKNNLNGRVAVRMRGILVSLYLLIRQTESTSV